MMNGIGPGGWLNRWPRDLTDRLVQLNEIALLDGQTERSGYQLETSRRLRSVSHFLADSDANTMVVILCPATMPFDSCLRVMESFDAQRNANRIGTPLIYAFFGDIIISHHFLFFTFFYQNIIL